MHGRTGTWASSAWRGYDACVHGHLTQLLGRDVQDALGDVCLQARQHRHLQVKEQSARRTVPARCLRVCLQAPSVTSPRLPCAPDQARQSPLCRLWGRRRVQAARPASPGIGLCLRYTYLDCVLGRRSRPPAAQAALLAAPYS